MKDRNEEERDILKEVGNIGAGNALTSLSMMLDQPLDLGMPDCQIVRRQEAGSLLDDPTHLYAGVALTMTGTIDCVLLLLMNKEFAEMVAGTLDSEEPVLDVNALTDMQKSALSEVGNIMGNAYITALGTILDIRIDVSVPRIAVDEGSQVLNDFLIDHEEASDRLLFINSGFTAKGTKLKSCILLCPTDDSLSSMISQLSF